MEAEKMAAQAFFKGLQALKEGQLVAAEVELLEALKLAPGRPSVLTNLSIVYTRQGRLVDALAKAEAACAHAPGDPLCALQAGAVLLALRRDEEALTVLDGALEQGGIVPELHYNRGHALKRLGRLEEALASINRAVALRPDYGEALEGRGAILLSLERPEEALVEFERCITLGFTRAATFVDHGRALRRLGRYEEALRSYQRAIDKDPALAVAYVNRGSVLEDLQRYEEALEDNDRAISLEPRLVEAHSNRGNVLMELGRLREAAEAFEAAKLLEPDFHSVLWNEANLLLVQGQLNQGFQQYENRRSRLNGVKHRKLQRPQLTACDDLAGKRLLIWNEMYLGDMIQFCRYGQVADAMGARVTIAAPMKLHRLLSTLSPRIAVASEETSDAEFDFQLPILSSPLALQRQADAFPASVPYLKAEPDRVAAWRQKIGTHGLKVGICWQGSKLSERDGRSFHLREFLGLSKIGDVRLISLQKFDGVEQLNEIPAEMSVETLGGAFDEGQNAFLDTAAVMDCVDLVITCDTAIAHLGGALAKPTWVLLKAMPEWRWFLNRADCPWYPHTRLFRQSTRGDWVGAFAEVRDALSREYGI